jgi:NAD(P)-dependent dehydrogenase (short-subunit alcohol dehydrogenase family)
MGRGAAIAFAREGADVAINYLPAGQSEFETSRQAARPSLSQAVSRTRPSAIAW